MPRLLLLAAMLLAAPALADTQLTIYNQDFATVKETRTLTLPKGESEIRVTDITAHLEPDSVVLRDLSDPGGIRILEQNYESDPLSEGLLLRRSEGKTLDFETTVPQTGEKRTVKGKVLRSGYLPHSSAIQRYGPQYASRQHLYTQPQGGGQPVVEVDGKILFGLPGKPVFEALDPGAFLKPTLLWHLRTGRAGEHRVEFSYLTGGMRWEATYNAVAPEEGDAFDIVGWVTLENMSGKDFDGAQVKLMAGDVARVPEGTGRLAAFVAAGSPAEGPAAVSERAFEEYHLYTLPRPLRVRDREIKQVEFVRSTGVPGKRIYVYDGFLRNSRYRGWDSRSILTRPEYGTESNPKVWAMLEFENRESSRLGMALPRGKVKIYRRDLDGRNEFVGEDAIDHTPKDETVRLYTGNAFDLVGERRQTHFRLDSNNRRAEESFEIKVRNHKAEAAEVRVVEHLYRGLQWEVIGKSAEYRKSDVRTIEFRPRVPGGGEAMITYTVRYTW